LLLCPKKGAIFVSRLIVAAFVVTFVSACGAEPRRPAAAPSAPAEPALPSNPEDDYVVGPFITASGTDEIRTYYIVRN
jgi:hypothetical protein